MGGGASVSSGDIPNVMDEAECRTVAGQFFDEGLFRSIANDGKITKAKLAEVISARTDCFLSHDWGNELGQNNHARVALVNAALQKRGLKTWFDTEQMQGNIKKQMAGGIDNAQCVIVFVTKRYVEKVTGNNTEDNCQLEFNYSAMRKTSTRMVSVVMEERMRDTRAWKAEFALVLGSRLYVDMCGDLSNSAYLNSKADELVAAILKVIGTPVKQFDSKLNLSNAHTSGKLAGPHNLESLNETQLGQLLEHCNFTGCQQLLKDQHITGMVLSTGIDSWSDLQDIGMSALPAKALFKQITQWKTDGLPATFLATLQPAPSATRASGTSKMANTTAADDATARAKADYERNLATYNKYLAATKDLPKSQNPSISNQLMMGPAMYAAYATATSNPSGLASSVASGVSTQVTPASYASTSSQPRTVGTSSTNTVATAVDDARARALTDYDRNLAEHNRFLPYKSEGKQSMGMGPEIAQMMTQRRQADEHFAMAERYANGDGIAKDATEAFKYYKMAAEEGLVDAHCKLGYCYANGAGISVDVQKAFRHYKIAADNGNAEGMFRMGVRYAASGTTQDSVESARYFKMAAEKGHDIAQYRLGVCYEKGIGVTADMQAAVKYYALAADQNHANALYHLGLCYDNGTGVGKNQMEAWRRMERAAYYGNKEAIAWCNNTREGK